MMARAGLAGDTPAPWARAQAAELNQRYAGRDTRDLLAAAIGSVFAGRVAAVSSFGVESVVLLHLIAQVDRATPVIFLETGQLFAQTLQYRAQVTELLELTNVRIERPDTAALAAADPQNDLWQREPDRCCHLRKVLPLARALEGFDAWISGRKRFQGQARGAVPLAEADGARVKVNPLAWWDHQQIDAYFAAQDLPRHPLEAFGFLSIGCHPCTEPVAPGGDARDGRWAGNGKVECGIHRPQPPRRPVHWTAAA